MTVAGNFTGPIGPDRVGTELLRAQREAETARIIFAVQSGDKVSKIAKDMGVTPRWVERRITDARRSGVMA